MGDHILVLRNGGMGDVLMTTPVLRGLKEKYPGAVLAYMTFHEWEPLLEDNPHVDSIIPLANHWGPWPEIKTVLPYFNIVVDLVMAAEQDKYLADWNRVEAFCDVAEVKPSSFKTVLVWPKRERDLKRILLHTDGTAAERCWPASYYARLAAMLKECGFQVTLIGTAGKVGLVDGAEDLCGQLGLSQTIDLIASSAALVGPDSGPFHIAAALSTPTVGIFGPIPPELRVKHYSRHVVTLRSNVCAPCHHTPRCGVSPTEEADRGKAPCMATVYPEQAIKALEGLRVL